MIWKWILNFYYHNKRVSESFFMIIVGVVVFLLFWFLPPVVTLWDRFMHILGYVCASLSFVFGWIFLLGIAPKSMKQSYQIAEEMVSENEHQKQVATVPSLLALNKTLAFFVPLFVLAILGVTILGYKWQNICYILIFAGGYYIYKYIQLKNTLYH